MICIHYKEALYFHNTKQNHVRSASVYACTWNLIGSCSAYRVAYLKINEYFLFFNNSVSNGQPFFVVQRGV